MDVKKFPKKPSDTWKEKGKSGGGGDILAVAKKMQAAQLRDERVKKTRKKHGKTAEATTLREEE